MDKPDADTEDAGNAEGYFRTMPEEDMEGYVPLQHRPEDMAQLIEDLKSLGVSVRST